MLRLRRHLRDEVRLDLGHDIVGIVPLYGCTQSFAIEHREHFARIGQLHRGRVVIGIAGHDIGPQPLGRDNEFAPQFAGAEQEDLGGVAHAASSEASSP